VAVAVAVDRFRVDGVHLIAGGHQRGDQQPTVGLDADRHLLRVVGVVADQRVQPPDPLDALGHPLASEHPPVLVHDPHVVVVLGPVDADQDHRCPPPIKFSAACPTRALEEVWRTA